MNREQRRRLDRSKKKTATLAGVSLAAASGLFGAYLGNGRIPKAYAAAINCSGSTFSYNVASDDSWIAAVNLINTSEKGKNCFVVNITDDFTISQNLADTHPIDVSSESTAKKFTLNGNSHTVTGDDSVPEASWMYIKLATAVTTNEAHISELTITRMRQNTGSVSPVANIWAPNGGGHGAVAQFWDKVRLYDNESGRRGQGIVTGSGKLEVSDSKFVGNSVISSSYQYGGVFKFQSRANAPAVQSEITNSVFERNVVTGSGSYGIGGGAVILAGPTSSLTIDNSTFDHNSATGLGHAYGGAVATNVPLIVRDSIFTNNTATSGGVAGGGAIAVNPAKLSWNGLFGGVKVYDSLFSGNQVTTSGAAGSSAGGGAIFGNDSPLGLRIENSTFHGNAVSGANADTYGGAVAFDDSSIGAVLSIVNSTFSSNSSLVTGDGLGGAIFAIDKPLSVDFSTITGNTGYFGGGIFALEGATLTNSIVNANTATIGADVFSGGTFSDHSLFTSAGDVFGQFTQGTGTLFSAAAQVGAVADNGGTVIGAPSDDTVIPTMLPLPGALVLDAGTVTPASGVLPTTDERGTGFPRVEFGLTTMGAVQRLGTPPPPPPPPPVFPPSAPRDVVGAADDGSVAVSWQPPTDSGSFPVTNYLVTAGPGGKTCLATAPALTCTVTGLTNGVAYTFVVKALNGAGWGPDGGPSAPVTPSAKARSLTLFQGKRAADGRHDRITTGGTSVGVPEGARLTPWIRYGDTGAFVEGVASIVVGSDGGFTWTRQIRKDRKFTAYVAYEDLESNRVTWQRVR